MQTSALGLGETAVIPVAFRRVGFRRGGPATVLLCDERLRATRGNAERRGLTLGQRLAPCGEPAVRLLQVAAIGARLDFTQGPIPVGRHQRPALRQRLETKPERGVADRYLLCLQHPAVELLACRVQRTVVDS